MYSYEKKVYTLMIINSTNINKTNKFEWPFLESRRANFRTTMMYIMTKYLTSVNTSDKLIPLQRPSINCNNLAFSILSCKSSISFQALPPSVSCQCRFKHQCKYSAHKFCSFYMHTPKVAE